MVDVLGVNGFIVNWLKRDFVFINIKIMWYEGMIIVCIKKV